MVMTVGLSVPLDVVSFINALLLWAYVRRPICLLDVTYPVATCSLVYLSGLVADFHLLVAALTSSRYFLSASVHLACLDSLERFARLARLIVYSDTRRRIFLTSPRVWFYLDSCYSLACTVNLLNMILKERLWNKTSLKF